MPPISKRSLSAHARRAPVHDMELAGRRALITGCLGTLGRDLAAAFHRAGAELLLTDRAGELPPDYPVAAAAVAHYFCADIGTCAGAEALARRAIAAGAPDILVNNAGIFPFVDLLDSDGALFDRIIAVNARAPFLLMRDIGAAMAASGRPGAIVNVSSAAAEVVRQDGVLYGASKAALETMTRAFAVRLAPLGIRVNAVRPGIATRPGGAIPVEHLQRIAGAVPMGRTLRESEFAALVLFLCGEHAAFITGQVIAVDGGSSLHRRMSA